MIDGLHTINGFTLLVLLVILIAALLPLIIERKDD